MTIKTWKLKVKTTRNDDQGSGYKCARNSHLVIGCANVDPEQSVPLGVLGRLVQEHLLQQQPQIFTVV